MRDGKAVRRGRFSPKKIDSEKLISPSSEEAERIDANGGRRAHGDIRDGGLTPVQQTMKRAHQTGSRDTFTRSIDKISVDSNYTRSDLLLTQLLM